MYKIEAIIRPEKLEAVQLKLRRIGYPGMMVTEMEGHGRQKGLHSGWPDSLRVNFLPKTKLEIVVDSRHLEAVIKAITAVGGPENIDAIPALKKSLDSRSNNVRRLAAEALGRMGQQAKQALPDLSARLRVEEDNGVRTAISEAIVEITRPRE